MEIRGCYRVPSACDVFPMLCKKELKNFSLSTCAVINKKK